MSDYTDATGLNIIGQTRDNHRCIDRLIDTPGLREMTGLTREAIHARVKAGTLPAPVGVLNGGRVWARSDIYDWLDTIPIIKPGNQPMRIAALRL